MNIIKQIKNEFIAYQCKQNYKRKLQSIKGNKKLRVVFLVSENQKWGYQSVYDALENDEHFEPLILISLLDVVHKGKDTTRANLAENYNFFKSRGMNVEYAYRNKNYLDLKSFSPDIVFYEQPWGLPKIYKPYYVSKFALTCYSDYGFEFFCNSDNYKANFHKLLWTFFVDNELNVRRYESYQKNNSKNCKVVGYPKLDVYLNNSLVSNEIPTNNKTKIIYAPHHSFAQNSLNLATFQENGKFILSLAQKYSDKTFWIFKPHPQFKFALLENSIMSGSEIENYYNSWQNLGCVYTQGDYFNLFKNSDLMVTDCSSFLGEYLPTNRPILQLVNPNHQPFNEFGNIITSQNYKAYTCEDIEKIFNKIVVQQNDYLAEKRKKLVQKLINNNEPSAKRVLLHLIQSIIEKLEL